MLTIKNDCTLEPWGWKVNLRDSRHELMAPTRDMVETIYADGEYDFGTELDTGEMQLVLYSEQGLTPLEIAEQKAVLAGQLNSLREYTLLVWESDPGKGIYVRLTGTVEITDHPGWFEADILLKYQPIWVSTEEQTHVGSGTITNEGTFEAPLTVEILGPAINPSVVIANKTMIYTGALAAGDKLIIETDKQTAKFNGVNALANYNRVFPKLLPGGNEITTDGNVTIKWRHCWI